MVLVEGKTQRQKKVQNKKFLLTSVFVFCTLLAIIFFTQSSKGNNELKSANELSPFFSTKPLENSLHPKYKLWEEMNSQEQEEALKDSQKIMKKYGELIAPSDKGRHKWKSIKHGSCVFDKDVGKNGHTLCGPKPSPPCSFISFGINDDPSFDIDIGSWGCRGFAGDPTVHHPSKLHENVTFHNIGATMLQNNEERNINKGGKVEWWMTSFPKLRYFLGLEKIDILKIDCEGCEVALSRDILREDPTFFFHVDQISIETHVTKTWMTTKAHVYYFGLLLLLLEDAGFVMEWSSVFGCSKRHEVAGCMEEISSVWPCGYDPWPKHPNAVIGRSCQEYTWKRY